MKVSFGFLIQAPFFVAAYQLLSNFQDWRGTSFLLLRDLRLASEPQALILRRTEPFAGLRRTRIQKPKTRKTNGENQQKNQRRQTNGDKPEATSTAGVLRTHLTANN